MDILILGGTRFLGRHIVEAGLARGHTITLFNRGRTNPGLFPQVETLLGDRDGGLQVLAGRQWQAVIDICGYLPRLVAASTNLLAAQIEHITFISSISVYANFHLPGPDEDSAVGVLADPDIEEITGDTYGPLKALCERAVQAAMPDQSLIIRPGLIVGPFDPSDRFTYWPVRVQRGGQMLAPESPLWPTQFIDARDLAAWTLDMIERRQTGIYNATGPDSPLPFGKVLETSRRLTGSQAEIFYLPEEFYETNQVQPWTELPLWLPGDENAGADRVVITKALAAGLKFRPLADTIADTLSWVATRPADHTWRAGLAPEREAALLEIWRMLQPD